MTNQTPITITEKALLYKLECPLRSDGINSGPEVPILHCAESTAKWLIDEIAAGRNPTATETRDFYDTEWRQTAYFHSRDAIPLKRWNKKLMEGVRACCRLRDLFWRCEILQRMTPYELPVDDVVITGEYTVLRSYRRKNHLFIPYFRYGGVKIRPLIPDIVSFARWLDVSRQAEQQGWSFTKLNVMHYWLVPSLAAEHDPNPELAAQVLRGAAAAISGPPYPIVGAHCLTCPTHNCRAAIKMAPA